jgi:hypothetical protein
MGELSEDLATCTIPAARTKNGIPHLVASEADFAGSRRDVSEVPILLQKSPKRKRPLAGCGNRAS